MKNIDKHVNKLAECKEIGIINFREDIFWSIKKIIINQQETILKQQETILKQQNAIEDIEFKVSELRGEVEE